MNGVISERNNRRRMVLIPIVLLLITSAFLYTQTSPNIVEAESNLPTRTRTDMRFPALPDEFDPNPNGTSINKVVVQDDGKIIIAGDFNQLMPAGCASATVSNLARLDKNGCVDTQFAPAPDGPISSVALQSDGKVLVTGTFSNIGGAPRSRVARLNAINGSLDTSFDPLPSGDVFFVVFDSGKIYLGGNFNTIAGQPRGGIARFDGSGNLDDFNTSQNGGILRITVQPNGSVLIAGTFNMVAGQTRRNIARLSSSGGLEAFDPITSGIASFNSIVVQPSDSKILLGGGEMNIGGQTRYGLVRLYADGSLDSAFNPILVNVAVRSIALQPNGKILFGGNFFKGIARVDIDGTSDSEFEPNANDEVFAIAVQPDGKIIVGGIFSTITLDGTPVTRNHIARLLPTERFEADVTPRPNPDGIVDSTDVSLIRRFVAGLDTPANPSEFQRADCAPTNTFGDGELLSTDVVVARSYGAGTLPLTSAKGPTGPPPPHPGGELILDNLFGDFGNKRTLTVGNASVIRANVVHVPIEITPFGGEAAVAFTLEYNRSVLARPRARLGNAAPKGSELTVNTNEAGRIGVLVDSEETVRPSSSPRTIVWISFDVIGNVGSGTNLMFSDSLAVRSASDAAGNLLRFNYINGTISSARQ